MMILLAIGFVLLLLVGVPIGITLIIASSIPSFVNPRFIVDLQYIIMAMVSGLDVTTQLAIPLFMLSGIIMGYGKISKLLFDVFSFFIGKCTGGLPCAVVVTCLFYGAISGSGPATTAAVGMMTIPLLVSLGYELSFCAALVAVAGGLGVIIPPSIPFIMYSNSSSVSVGDMFMGGVVPGILIGAMLMGYAYFYCKKHVEDKEKINASVDKLRAQGLWKIMRHSSWALMTPIIVLGGIYSGIVTPTEAALVSVLYSLFISLFIYKTVTCNDIFPILVQTARTLVPCVLIIGAASAFAKVLAVLHVPQLVAETLGGLVANKILLLVVINAILLVIGMLIDTGASILIMTPIFLPVVTMAGIDPVHFGVLMVVNLAIGFVTPPVGMNLFVAAAMTKLSATVVAKKAVPLLIAFAAALLIITYIPQVTLCLINN